MGGTKGSIQSIDRFTPEQQQVISSLMGDFDPTRLIEGFQQGVADPARQQFQQQTIPGLQESLISAGGARSSALPRMATQAAADLEGQLSGQLAQLLAGGEQQQRQMQAQLATTPMQQQFFQQGSSPLTGLLGALGQIGGGVGGGAGGAYIGSKMAGKI